MPTLEKRKMSYKRTRRGHDVGVVYDPETDSSFTEEEIEKISKELSSLSFDPHLVTEKIIEFGKVLTGVYLYGYQYWPVYRIIYSVITVEGAEVSMLWSRQSGKTEAIAFCIDTLCVILPVLAKIIPDLHQYKDGIRIGLFAPQGDQVETTYGRAMMRLTGESARLVMSDPEIDTELKSSVNLNLSNGSYLKGQTASKISKIESKTYDLVIMEEAQDLDTFIVQKSIEPMTSATNGTVVKIGTTGTSKNHYWYDIMENKRRSRSVKDKRLVYHFENDYRKVMADKRKQFLIDGRKFHLNYEKDVEKKKRKWGEDSDAFKLSYALIWALDVGMFFSDEEFDAICNKKKGFPKDVSKDTLNEYVVAGLDIAKSDASTVLTIAKVSFPEEGDFVSPLKEIIGWVELRGTDYEMQHHLIMEALIEYNITILAADYTGVGKPVVDRLTYACGEYVNIIPYTFSRPSKSDMWVALQNDIRNRRIIVPANKVARNTAEFKRFEEQAKTLQKYYEGSFLVAEKLEGTYDDYMDSLALMVIAGNQPVGEEQEIEDEDINPLYDQRNLEMQIMRASAFS